VAALLDNAPDVIAIDGKTSRRCHARGKGRGPPYACWTSIWRSLGREIAPDAALFRNCSGAPYSKDTLGDDFRAGLRRG
jgi:hypothetical protein